MRLVTYLDIVAEVVCHDAAQDVEGNVGARVTQMRVVVHCGTTRVPGHFIGVLGNEFVFVACEGVEDAEFGLFVCCDKKEGILLALVNRSCYG